MASAAGSPAPSPNPHPLADDPTDVVGARVGQHVLDSVLLIVDTLSSGLVGLVVMLVRPRHQRVGDLAAGTLVVRPARARA